MYDCLLHCNTQNNSWFDAAVAYRQHSHCHTYSVVHKHSGIYGDESYFNCVPHCEVCQVLLNPQQQAAGKASRMQASCVVSE